MQLGFVMESEDRNTVFWIERRASAAASADKQNVFLQATPIDVAPILKATLFDKLETAVLTSATLAVSGGFEYMRGRLGLEHARESRAAFAFRLPEPGAVLCSAGLPDPRKPQFAAKAADRIRRLLEITPRARILPVHQLCADERGL